MEVTLFLTIGGERGANPLLACSEKEKNWESAGENASGAAGLYSGILADGKGLSACPFWFAPNITLGGSGH